MDAGEVAGGEVEYVERWRVAVSKVQKAEEWGGAERVLVLGVVGQAAGAVLPGVKGDLRDMEVSSFARYMDAGRITEVFGRRRTFTEIGKLSIERIARVGAPVDVGPGGTFRP